MRSAIEVNAPRMEILVVIRAGAERETAQTKPLNTTR
jgi:hypothetical protein